MSGTTAIPANQEPNVDFTPSLCFSIKNSRTYQWFQGTALTLPAALAAIALVGSLACVLASSGVLPVGPFNLALVSDKLAYSTLFVALSFLAVDSVLILSLVRSHRNKQFTKQELSSYKFFGNQTLKKHITENRIIDNLQEEQYWPCCSKVQGDTPALWGMVVKHDTHKVQIYAFRNANDYYAKLCALGYTKGSEVQVEEEPLPQEPPSEGVPKHEGEQPREDEILSPATSTTGPVQNQFPEALDELIKQEFLITIKNLPWKSFWPLLNPIKFDGKNFWITYFAPEEKGGMIRWLIATTRKEHMEDISRLETALFYNFRQHCEWRDGVFSQPTIQAWQREYMEPSCYDTKEFAVHGKTVYVIKLYVRNGYQILPFKQESDRTMFILQQRLTSQFKWRSVREEVAKITGELQKTLTQPGSYMFREIKVQNRSFIVLIMNSEKGLVTQSQNKDRFKAVVDKHRKLLFLDDVLTQKDQYWSHQLIFKGYPLHVLYYHDGTKIRTHFYTNDTKVDLEKWVNMKEPLEKNGEYPSVQGKKLSTISEEALERSKASLLPNEYYIYNQETSNRLLPRCYTVQIRKGEGEVAVRYYSDLRAVKKATPQLGNAFRRSRILTEKIVRKTKLAGLLSDIYHVERYPGANVAAIVTVTRKQQALTPEIKYLPLNEVEKEITSLKEKRYSDLHDKFQKMTNSAVARLTRSVLENKRDSFSSPLKERAMPSPGKEDAVPSTEKERAHPSPLKLPPKIEQTTPSKPNFYFECKLTDTQSVCFKISSEGKNVERIPRPAKKSGMLNLAEKLKQHHSSQLDDGQITKALDLLTFEIREKHRHLLKPNEYAVLDQNGFCCLVWVETLSQEEDTLLFYSAYFTTKEAAEEYAKNKKLTAYKPQS